MASCAVSMEAILCLLRTVGLSSSRFCEVALRFRTEVVERLRRLELELVFGLDNLLGSLVEGDLAGDF